MNAAFFEVNFRNTGVLNNVEFFVMWRDLEHKMQEMGLVGRYPLPDRELKTLFGIYDDYNGFTEGVTLDDFINCRSYINKQLKDKQA